MTEHTVKSYGEELNHLTAEVTRMGGLAEAQVADAVDCIARRDAPLAQLVVGRDERLDTLQTEIERKAFRLIALRQPMAVDLRHAVAALKISMSLERCGDMAKNIGKRALILTEADPMTALTRSIERMGRLVQRQRHEGRPRDARTVCGPLRGDVRRADPRRCPDLGQSPAARRLDCGRLRGGGRSGVRASCGSFDRSPAHVPA